MDVRRMTEAEKMENDEVWERKNIRLFRDSGWEREGPWDVWDIGGRKVSLCVEKRENITYEIKSLEDMPRFWYRTAMAEDTPDGLVKGIGEVKDQLSVWKEMAILRSALDFLGERVPKEEL